MLCEAAAFGRRRIGSLDVHPVNGVSDKRARGDTRDARQSSARGTRDSAYRAGITRIS